MTRNRASAKAAGARFERVIADYLANELDEFIDRKVRRGRLDCGDIGGVRVRKQRLVVEVKDCARTDLPGWVREAQTEAANDGAVAGVVVSKRHGVGDPSQQWVHLTVGDLVAILKAARDV